MRYIDELSREALTGKRVLVRAGLNVPVEHGEVVNDFRIIEALPTLQFLRNAGAQVTIVAHIGRDPKETLAPVAKELQKHIPELVFVDRSSMDKAEDARVVLQENLRQDPREKENDSGFAKELAEGFDVFVQDAFSVCHRAHASIVGIPEHLPSYGGLLLKKEITVLQGALTPKAPAAFVLGGAKFATKEPLIKKFLDVYGKVFVGGALANEFLKACGLEVGQSLIEDGLVDASMRDHSAIVLPEEVIVVDGSGASVRKHVADVSFDDRIVDAFVPKGFFSDVHTVLWNGPLGYYEGGFDEATRACARSIAHVGAVSIVGGGDTVAAITASGLADSFSHLSTGGGAMLAFLQDRQLPGLVVLK